jgi:outer membrane protein assembly factor BamB
MEGRLFESDGNRVQAIDARTGRLVFSGNVGPQATRPAVVGATVYVASGSSLVSFPVACAGRCPASSRVTLTGGPVVALVGAPGVEALATVGADGSLRTYAPDCGASGGSCVPVWTASEGTFSAVSAPSVDPTGVSGVTTDGSVLRFPLDCAGRALCPPTWRGRAVAGAPSGLAESGGVVVAATSGGVAAFGVDCAHGGGTCDPLWRVAVPGGVVSPPAVGAGVVVVGSGDGRVYGFPMQCEPTPGSCQPAWRSVAGLHIIGAPAIAGGVAFVATADGRLAAFSTRCSAACRSLWSDTVLKDRVPPGGPVVSGKVVIGVGGDQMVGFTPGGQ